MWLPRKQGYTIISRAQNTLLPKVKSLHSTTVLAASTLLANLVGIVVGYLCTTRLHLQARNTLGQIKSDYLTTSWTYNQTFSMEPTPERIDAWNAILPEGSGFITHPDISPLPSALAAFHQLHCLNMLWLQYYSNITEDLHNGHDPRAHMRHCFDYLRQSIMCAADSNLELVNNGLGGVTGWGSQRLCRDYDQLVAWASRWRSGMNKGIQ